MRVGSLRVGGPLADVLLLSLLLRLSTLVLLITIPHFLPSWDTSARPELPPSTHLEGLLRWDTLHFLRIAEREGGRHEVEKEWAFGRGIVHVLRVGERMLAPYKAGDASVEVRRERMVIGGSFLALAASVASGAVLYQLTFQMTGNRRFARLTILLHALSPAPATLVVAYTEPFFALFSFAGSLCLLRKQKLLAAGCWAAATWFRQLGVFNAGFFVWEWLCELRRPKGVRNIQTIVAQGLATCILAGIVVSPFVHSQREAYVRFCIAGKDPRPWCARTLPLAYTWAQEHYWEVGFLRYWVPKQVPLFLMSAPVYALLFWTLHRFFTRLTFSSLLPSPSSSARRPFPPPQPRRDPYLDPIFAPHVHLTLFLTATLLFHSHVQIVLRQVFTMPLAWWGAASLVGGDRKLWTNDEDSKRASTSPDLRKTTAEGRSSDDDTIRRVLRADQSWESPAEWSWADRWIRWCLVWGSISVVLWATFLPPA